MTQQVSSSVPAGPGERFAHGAFDSQVGRTVPFRVEGSSDAAEATVIAAEISDDGTAVTLTLDVPDGTIPAPTPGWLSLADD
jgi:hypothetical protein